METPRPPLARAGAGPEPAAASGSGQALPEVTDYLGRGVEVEANFDDIARLAADLLGAPMALVILRGKGSSGGAMLPKALVGLGPEDAAGAAAFHRHVLASGEPLLVPDAAADGRFASCTLVSGPPGVRFCAAAPLTGRGRKVLGALLVFDTAPRAALRDGYAAHLAVLARTAVQHLEVARLHAVAVASSQIADSTSDAFLCADSRGAITYWNRSAEALFGYAREEAVGMPLDSIIPGWARAARENGPERPADKPVEMPGRHKSGAGLEVELALSSWQQDGALAVGAIVRDITERKRAEEELRRTRAFAHTVVESVPAMLFVKDAADLRHVLLNKAGEELLGVPRGAVLDKAAADLFPPEQARGFEESDREALRLGAVHVTEEVVSTPGRGERLLLTTRLAIPGEDGRPAYLLGFSEDITERREAEARIAHMAGHDALTGLPNRTLLRDRLEQALAVDAGPAGTGEGAAAVLCLDLDRFKEVNDTLGHPVGDALLREVAVRLRACARGKDVVARLGGDEFAVVLAAPAGTPEGAAGFAGRVVEALAEPFLIEGHQLQVGASIGIAVAPTDGTDADTLLRRADMALNRAKAEGRSTWHFFEPGLDAQLQRRRALEADLRSAVREGRFELRYQPLFRTPSGRVTGVEALLRWRRDGDNLVAPGDFIPLAEQTGLIAPIGDWVLRTACAEVARWPSDTLSVAVNLSPAQFRRGDLVDSVQAALAASGLAPGRLELEITESVLLENDEATLGTLRKLRALGVRIAMDDFGTGYSSLGYLQRFPFDKVKIDRLFVQEMARNANCMAIVRAVVSLGATLGATITAEGVETQEQLALLRDIGCEEAQGFLLGSPKTAAEVVEQHLPPRGGAAPARKPAGHPA